MSRMIQLEPIRIGSEISLPNCVGFFKVLRRTGPSRYEIDFRGTPIIVKRERDTLVREAKAVLS